MHAPMYIQALAGNVARFFRRQEGDEAGNIFRIAEIPHRYVERSKRGLIFWRRMHALVNLLAVNAPRADAVHRDALFRQLAGNAFRPNMHPRLGDIRSVDDPNWSVKLHESGATLCQTPRHADTGVEPACD